MQNSQIIKKDFIKRIQEHQGILHKICFMYAKTGTDKEDLYQEIVLELWKSYSSFENKSKFSTWMYRVALNTAITYIKKSSRFHAAGTGMINFVEHEDSSAYSEDVKILYAAISHLNSIDKAIVLLWLEEKTYAEIADTVGISEKNVSVKMVRIKRKLAKIIKKIT